MMWSFKSFSWKLEGKSLIVFYLKSWKSAEVGCQDQAAQTFVSKEWSEGNVRNSWRYCMTGESSPVDSTTRRSCSVSWRGIRWYIPSSAVFEFWEKYVAMSCMGNRTSSNFLADLYWITTKIDFLMWDTANKDKNRLRNWNYLGQSLPTCTFSCRRGQKGTKIIWSQLWNGREMVKIIILDRKTVNFIFWYFLLNNGFYSGCNMQDLRSSDNSCAVPTIIIPREKKTSGSAHLLTSIRDLSSL